MSAFATIKLAHNVLKQIDQAAERALVQTADAVRKDIKKAQVIPFDTGALQDSMFSDELTVHRGEVDISFNTPYARRLFYHPEYNFHREAWTGPDGKEHTRANAHAKDHWTEDWEAGGSREDFAEKTFAKAIRQEAKL